MDVDFERSIESDQDLLDLDRKLLLPFGTPFYSMYTGSPLRAQREVAARVDPEEDMFVYEEGLQSLEVDKRMLEKGKKNLIIFYIYTFNSF